MKERDFVSYEYRTIMAKAKEQSRVMDIYEAFGWEVTGTTPSFADVVTISLKRDRKQKHKQELVKLERQAESTYATIKDLQKSKTRGANVFAYIFGSLSSLVFGGGMCLCLLKENSVPALVGGSVLGIIGIALCGINYLIYKKIVEKKTREILPVIDDNEEALANVLEKGNDLLNADII